MTGAQRSFHIVQRPTSTVSAASTLMPQGALDAGLFSIYGGPRDGQRLHCIQALTAEIFLCYLKMSVKEQVLGLAYH